jgi:hypothetical protein
MPTVSIWKVEFFCHVINAQLHAQVLGNASALKSQLEPLLVVFAVASIPLLPDNASGFVIAKISLSPSVASPNTMNQNAASS